MFDITPELDRRIIDETEHIPTRRIRTLARTNLLHTLGNKRLPGYNEYPKESDQETQAEDILTLHRSLYYLISCEIDAIKDLELRKFVMEFIEDINITARQHILQLARRNSLSLHQITLIVQSMQLGSPLDPELESVLQAANITTDVIMDIISKHVKLQQDSSEKYLEILGRK